MTTAISNQTALPTDAKTGLTLPLSRSLGSQDLAKHRAMLAVELEVMAKKMDRFGWERDRDTAAHDRVMVDWMDALQDYPLSEVKAACRAWVQEQPRKMANEGDILRLIMRGRAVSAREHMARHAPEPEAPKVTAEDRRAIAAVPSRKSGSVPKVFPRLGRVRNEPSPDRNQQRDIARNLLRPHSSRLGQAGRLHNASAPLLPR